MEEAIAKVSRDCIECDACGKSGPVKSCSRCKLCYYCGPECQKQHWNVHKEDCISVDSMRASIAGIGESIPEAEAVNSACGICLEESMEHPVVLAGCRHAFCFQCIQHWHSYSQTRATSTSCPYCRKDVEKGVEESILENALLYATRAQKIGVGAEERKELSELALAEVDKILDSDGDHLQALCTKGQILAQYDPEQAIEVYQKVLDVDREGNENAEQMTTMLDQMKVAKDAGNDDEAGQILERIEEFHSSVLHMKRIGSGPARLFDIRIMLAEVNETLENWNDALDIYKEMLLALDDPSVASPPQLRMIWSGLSRCFYHLGDYASAISAGEAALGMNRHFPGVHKLLALPQRAQGNIDAARKTMSRAVFYETPWDDHNRREVLALKNELDEMEA